MTDSKKAQAVGALRKCAKEHEKDFTPTFNIRVSDLCSDVADYLEELKKENEEQKTKIENMQIMEYSNLYEQRKNLHKNLIDEFTEQLGIMDKEEDVLFSLKEIKSIIDFIME